MELRRVLPSPIGRLVPGEPLWHNQAGHGTCARGYDRACGLRLVAFRYFNAAGADESGAIGEMHSPETHLIPCALQAIQDNRPLQIFGDDYPTEDGTCVRDYIHVSDLAVPHVLGPEYLAGPSVELNPDTGIGQSVREILSAARFPWRFRRARAGDRRSWLPIQAKLSGYLSGRLNVRLNKSWQLPGNGHRGDAIMRRTAVARINS